MRAIVFAPDPFDRMLFAMAADALPLGVDLEFADSADAVAERLSSALTAGWLADVVVACSDGDGSALAVVDAIDRDPLLWPTPTFVVSTAANDDERIGAYARGADGYEQLRMTLAGVIAFLDQLPGRVDAVYELVGGAGVIDLAAADLVHEIEAYLVEPG